MHGKKLVPGRLGLVRHEGCRTLWHFSSRSCVRFCFFLPPADLGDTLFALMACAPSADELHDTRSEEEKQRIIKLLIDEHLHLYAKDEDVDCGYVTVDGKF